MNKEYTMEEALEAIIDYRGRTPKKSDSGILTLSAKVVKNNFIDYDNCYRISNDEYKNYMVRGFPKKGDILLTTEAPLGQVACLDREDVAIAQRLLTLRGKSGVLDNNYLLYFLQSNTGQKLLSAKESGSTVTGIKQSEFRKIKISLPEYNVQKIIGKTLKNFDDKIAINNKIIRYLESFAKDLYDYWFLQFEFPNENGKPYKSSGGKMVWNEELKQEIPAGWEIHNISDLCTLGNGINYNKKVTGDKTYKIVNVRDISASSLLINKQDMNEISLPNALANKYLVNKSDILIARSGTPGAVRLVLDTDNVIYCGFIIHCLPNDLEDRFYLTFTLKLYEGTSATKTGGSILQNVSQDTLKSLTIPLPSKNVLSSFNVKIKPLIDKMQLCIEENNQLASLRDFLLPMLMNGQVTIKEKA